MGNAPNVKMNEKAIKIFFLGDENVGKTALISKYVNNKVICQESLILWLKLKK